MKLFTKAIETKAQTVLYLKIKKLVSIKDNDNQ